MERATVEATHRGQAENAKDKIERELEELSASLFGEANGMVHEARVARSVSERKVEEAEGRLREAEEAVRIMQSQMQALVQEKEDVEQKPDLLTPNSAKNAVEGVEKLTKGHLAYQEYLTFLAHLRHIHVSNLNGVPPAMATLLQLPFLSRLLSEDACVCYSYPLCGQRI
jgi:chromosome segregation ATPase